MRHARRWSGALFVTAILQQATPARADVAPPPDPPEGKRVPAVIEIDWGPFADRVSHLHVVAAGETLRTIAAKELGDASRWKAIAENNPVVAADADKIAAGAELWLPPLRLFDAPPAATPPAPGLAPWYDAFWVQWGRYWEGVTIARASPGAIAEEWKAGGTLALVVHLAAAPMIEALAKERIVKGWQKLPAILKAQLYPDTLVHRDNPTVRIVCRYRLGGAEGGVIHTEVDRLRYDPQGTLVTKTWIIPEPLPFGPYLSGGGAPVPSEPNPPTDADESPAPADSGRWPVSTGLLVAGGGALAIGALWLLRRRKLPPAA